MKPNSLIISLLSLLILSACSNEYGSSDNEGQVMRWMVAL